MFDPMEVDTFWLNATNVALGIVTLVCLVVVGSVSFKEILERVRGRARERVALDDHAFLHGELGLTMADGGELLTAPPAKEANVNLDDEKNIQRSIN